MDKSKQNQYVYKYRSKAIKRIPLDIQKSYYDDVLKPYTEKKDVKINTFIKQCIDYIISNDITL